MYFLFLIPTAIIVLTVIVSITVRNGLRDYLNELDEKVRKAERILNLSLTRDLLSFVVNNSVKRASKIMAALEKGEDNSDDGEDVAKLVGNDIEDLYESFKKASEPNRHLDRVKFISGFITKLVLFYGVSISSIEYIQIYITYLPSLGHLSQSLDGIIFGIAIISSVILAVVIGDMAIYSRRIKQAADNVGTTIKNLGNASRT